MTRSRWTSDLHLVRPSQQSRSGKTQAALLQSAEKLFAERGTDATTVADIAEGAGCSVGAVYHHFRDKKAIQHALFDRLSHEIEATTLEGIRPSRWDGARIGDIVYGYLESTIEYQKHRPSTKRLALDLSRGEPELAARMDKLADLADHGVIDLIQARGHEIGHPEPETAVSFVVEQLGSMLRSRLYGARRPSLADDDFIRQATVSACGYLGVDLPAD